VIKIVLGLMNHQAVYTFMHQQFHNTQQNMKYSSFNMLAVKPSIKLVLSFADLVAP